MKIKTSELIGAALDWAVCKAVGMIAAYPKMESGKTFVRMWNGNSTKYVHPSTDWSQGGPIIEREGFWLMKLSSDTWDCDTNGESFEGQHQMGPTPLIAAMRCFVASKLGDEVDVPEELLS